MTAWWRDAVVYQVYIRSFADGDGDGTGDLAGLHSRLPYLADLGVDAIWVNPWYPSPLRDGGYDVADYRDINPLFGTLAEAETLIADAHTLGIKVIADIVPNHSSSDHQWFQDALAAAPGSRERARYWFRDGRGRGGDEPPNDWRSIFGGTAWTRVTEPDGRPGQWYLHLFDPSQPDLNWANPEVVEEFQSILRFWFDRGVDGFRIDVAHGMAKNPALPDLGVDDESLMAAPDRERHPHWDRDEVHEIYRGWRAVADSYAEPRMFVGEVWLDDPARLALYLRPDELNTSFAFEITDPDWEPAGIRAAIDSGLAAAATAGASPTWTLSNHDIPRHVSRYGRPAKERTRFGPTKYDFTGLDLDRGRRRARAAALLILGLPGSAYLYQGEELGLEEVTDIPDDMRDDPVFLRTGGVEIGRDGCRVPLPWEPQGASLGFGANGSWLPQPAHWAGLAVSAQLQDDSSMLSLYRRAIALRRAEPALHTLAAVWVDSPDEVLHLRRPDGRGGALEVVVNMSSRDYPLPDGAVLLASQAGTGAVLPPDAAVWLRPS
jgi:alpha-glucosidase